MKITLREVADLVKGRLNGDGSAEITGIAGIEEAKLGDLTFLASERYLPHLEKTKASGLLVGENIATDISLPHVRVSDPSFALAEVARVLVRPQYIPASGIHPTAVVAESAQIGKDVAIGALTVVEEGAEIGEGTVLYPQVYVGHSAKIGAHVILYPQVVICERCEVGANTILHSGVVVGSDGYGYASFGGRHFKIPQAGIAVVEDDVEIGANSTIDRARFNRTVVGKGTKIDNLVQIGHNVELGESCILSAQAGIAGSTTIGNNVMIGGQGAVIGHLNIADGSMVAAGAAIIRDTEPGKAYSGRPAVSHIRDFRQIAAVRKLPELIESVRKMKRDVEDLRSKS